MDGTWAAALGAALLMSGLLTFGYRIYRLVKGGPLGDAIGQGILAALLTVLAVATWLGATWPRWFALGYALLFGVIVMPVWVLAVLIPMRPGAPDYTFTVLYWLSLAAIAVAAIVA